MHPARQRRMHQQGQPTPPAPDNLLSKLGQDAA